MKKQQATIGSISHGTMRAEDLIPTFADELRRLRGALPKGIARDIRGLVGMSEDDLADAQPETLESLFDALNDYAPDYCYFGAHPGDGSDYGFWLYEDWQQLARDDGVLFVDDLSELDSEHIGYRGLVCHVSDHGNATLYSVRANGTLREIWSVV